MSVRIKYKGFIIIVGASPGQYQAQLPWPSKTVKSLAGAKTQITRYIRDNLHVYVYQ